MSEFKLTPASEFEVYQVAHTRKPRKLKKRMKKEGTWNLFPDGGVMDAIDSPGNGA